MQKKQQNKVYMYKLTLKQEKNKLCG